MHKLDDVTSVSGRHLGFYVSKRLMGETTYTTLLPSVRLLYPGGGVGEYRLSF